MRYILLSILVFLSVFIGYLFSKKYRNRKNFFQALVLLCNKFDIEINYSRERVKNIFDSLDEKIKINLYGMDNNFLSFINKENNLDKHSLFKNITFLKEEEKDVILLFFKSLGRSDVDSQSKEIKNFKLKFENLSSTSNNENKKYGSLSIKLGIIFGLLIIVLFI